MRVIGKLIIIISGGVVGLSVTFITLMTISSDTTPLILGLIPLFILYLIGWLASIFTSKQRLLFITLLIYIGYIVSLVGVIYLVQEPSQFTLTIGFIFLMFVGMAISKKKKRDAMNGYEN
jgi:hypothetical protein